MPGRLPQNPLKVPAKVYGDLKVKNEILGGASTKLAGICLFEMQQIFLCFKKFSYNEEACASEIKKFKACYDVHVKNFKNQSKGSGKMTATELTKLLQRFPERSNSK